MRVLITRGSSLSARWLAELLVSRPGVEAVHTTGEDDPTALGRIAADAKIDTIVEMRHRADGIRAYEEAGVRKLVLKSSVHYYGFDIDAPAFLTEMAVRRGRPDGPIERAVVRAEAAAQRFAAARPGRVVTIVRFADELGTGEGPHQALFGMPFVPAVLGFDPRWQLIHGHDVVHVLAHAVLRELPGIYNAAADGVLALSEIASLLGRPMVPVIPPLGSQLALAQLARVGIRGPIELLGQLRLGRGVDNRRLKATGYAYRYTSREAVIKLAEEQRMPSLIEARADPRLD